MSWLSGSCDPDEQPPTVVVFENRPADDDGPEVEQSGGVIYVAGRLAGDLWPFTDAAIAATEAEPLVDDGEEPTWGNALLRALAEASEGRLVELERGLYYETKLDSSPEE